MKRQPLAEERVRSEGGESSWKRMTSPVQREPEGGAWQRVGMGGGEVGALHGLAAEQMWMREGGGERKSIFIDQLVT